MVTKYKVYRYSPYISFFSIIGEVQKIKLKRVLKKLKIFWFFKGKGTIKKSKIFQNFQKKFQLNFLNFTNRKQKQNIWWLNIRSIDTHHIFRFFQLLAKFKKLSWIVFWNFWNFFDFLKVRGLLKNQKFFKIFKTRFNLIFQTLAIVNKNKIYDE